MANKVLQSAKAKKNDEFYTQLSDIEKELGHYRDQFKGKVVLCNCDDPRVSNFFHYFSYNFEYLGLKKLITTCYKNQDMNLFSTHQSEKAISIEYTWDKDWDRTPSIDEIGIKELRWDGDFRSPECIALLQEADIVVTNPPFSLFREYIDQLIQYDKKFLIIWNKNAITYKEVFWYIKENKVWLWYTSADEFLLPNGQTTKQVQGLTRWFTNLDVTKRHEELILYKKYNPIDYPRYDNYDGINIDKVTDIPMDYDWAMWVPITFLDKYNPDQFDILWIDRYIAWNITQNKRFTINWKEIYARVVIKSKI